MWYGMLVMKKVILDNIERYPFLRLVDILKLVHQSSYGCGHMIDNYPSFAERLKKEYYDTVPAHGRLYTNIGEGYCRIDLKSARFFGIDPELIAKICYFSSFSKVNGDDTFRKNLSVLRQMSLNHEIAFSTEEIDSLLDSWKKNGKGLFRHSECYRKMYSPAYRVCETKYACFLFLLDRMYKLSAEKNIVVGIDGQCASGKTTLSKLLEFLSDCNIIHADDFFIPVSEKESHRKSLCCNLDNQRFTEEIVKGIKSGKDYEYGVFNCSLQSISRRVMVRRKSLTVIEGSYCLHPEFSSIYDMKVFLTLDHSNQCRRIMLRNGKSIYKVFEEKWIPMEEEYFSKYRIKESCDFVINTDK